VFNAIADADSCAQALERAVTLVERTRAPVINSPAAVLGARRAANSALGDARDAGANYRKYRVMTIDGWLYPLQLTAEMPKDRHRAEEEKFLKDMPGALGQCAMAALADIQEALGLDYAGIDFGLSASGEVLLFGASAALTKVPTGRDQPWDYRRPAIQRVEDAVRKMLTGKAQVTQLRCDILAASSQLEARKCCIASFFSQSRALFSRSNPRPRLLRPAQANAPAPAPHCSSARNGRPLLAAVSTA
jgi:hypothetical protein